MAANSENDIYPCNKKGVCVIVTNFYGENDGTAHLPGYVEDNHELNTCFGTEMKYDVITETGGTKLLNLSCKQFDLAMESLQRELTERLSKDATSFDRFIMFVLSHGGQPGICMCEEGSNGEKFEVDEDDHAIYKPVEEIIECFSNEYIPKMAGIPKCFIIQACRGNNRIKQACNKDGGRTDATEVPTVVMEIPAIRNADIIVAYATLPTTLSYVHACGGSLFVSALVEEIGKRDNQNDLFEILTKVIKAFCKARFKAQFFAVNGPKIDVTVEHEGKQCPLLMYGKQTKSDNQEMPLFPAKKCYTHFAPCRQANQCLDQYWFDGNIEFHKQHFKMVHIPAEKLKAFADLKYFSIYGKMTHKTSGTATEEAPIEVHGNMFSMQKKGKKIKQSDLTVYGYIYGADDTLKVESSSSLLNKKAWLYIDGKFYHEGTLEKENNVWGMRAPIYQVPILTSTLRKKMHLVQPVVSKEAYVTIDALAEEVRIKLETKSYPTPSSAQQAPIQGTTDTIKPMVPDARVSSSFETYSGDAEMLHVSVVETKNLKGEESPTESSDEQ